MCTRRYTRRTRDDERKHHSPRALKYTKKNKKKQNKLKKTKITQDSMKDIPTTTKRIRLSALYKYKELWDACAHLRSFNASFIEPFKNHLLQPHMRNGRNNADIDFDAHLLLQGDFFLTSRCYPPKRQRVLKLSWTQREALAPRKEWLS
jgi:hypothetical protein